MSALCEALLITVQVGRPGDFASALAEEAPASLVKPAGPPRAGAQHRQLSASTASPASHSPVSASPCSSACAETGWQSSEYGLPR